LLFTKYYLGHQIKEDEMSGTSSTHGRGDKSQKLLLVNVKGRDHLENSRVDGRIILEWILKKYDGKVWNGFIWLGVGTGGGLL
jgi:hypothetical protein